MVNNAGMGITGPIEETPTEEMKKVFDTNLFGAVDVMKAVLPEMRKQNSGKIINVTSIAGYMGLPFRGVYSATKGALELITEATRMEVKQFGIHIVNVAPGDFATNIAAGRFHTPVFENSAYKKKLVAAKQWKKLNPDESKGSINAMFFDKDVRNYRMQVIKNFIVREATRPVMANSAIARMRPYDKAMQIDLDLMDAHVDGGMNPLVMAKAVYNIIETKSPKIHYKVGGFMEKFSIVLKRVLPDKMYEKLLMNHYKL